MIELELTREERRARFYRKFYADFRVRLSDATVAFERRRGRELTRTELAAMLKERTGKPITARCVGRWYRGLGAPQRTAQIIQLAELLNVHVGWLSFGEGERELPSRGVYETKDGFCFYDTRGVYIGDITLASRENEQAVINKCWELLDLVSPVRPTLRIESASSGSAEIQSKGLRGI